MMVPTPLAVRPVAHTPLVTRHTAPTHVSHPHGVLRRGQANGTSASSSTLRPVAPMDVSYPHVTSCPERTSGTSNSSSIALLSHLTDAPSHFRVASHVAHPHVAQYPVQSCASFAPPPMLPTSHSNIYFSHAALSSPPQVASHISDPCIPPCIVRTGVPFAPASTPPVSRSTVRSTSAGSSPPRRKRSRRCFVCGGTGKHRLNPRFCPRTYELLSKHLAMFDATFRLVSFDGSPLPMTRHPGGVAAHLLSPRRLPRRTAHASSRSISKPPGGSHANPPHVPHAPRDPPIRVPRRVPGAVPIGELNPSHAPYSSVARPHPIPVSERSIESNLPHFPPVERLPSPPVYLPVPLPDSKPPADSSSEDSLPHISLSIFELLFISPPIRDELCKLIDAMDRSNVGHEIPSSPLLRKVFFRIFDRMVDLLSSPP